MQLTSFPPIDSPKATILILGSMPGERSLRDGQYYAHPRNAFWEIMGTICGMEEGLSYQCRCQALIENRIALWDVLQHCERAGSLDSNIRPDTEIPNDFESFLETHAGIKQIFFNGGKAEQSFHKRVWPSLWPHIQERITLTRLPSTSPANARMTKEQKLVQWRSRIEPHLTKGK